MLMRMERNDSDDKNLKKSSDCREQLHVWSRLLEGRMAIQKIVIALRDLEIDRDDVNQRLDESTIKTISTLLESLVKLRTTYRIRSQFCLSESESNYGKIDDALLDQQHHEYLDLRRNLIDKWYDKTKIGTIPKKGYTALELPTSQLINNALKDKDKLIRRTQIDRTSQSDNPNPEIFNDDDFYHHLLKEVVSKDEGRKWVEIQRLRYKTKRKADTKATKGRKIKKDLIPKLVNFMAPTSVVDNMAEGKMPDHIRNELLKSLFGGGN